MMKWTILLFETSSCNKKHISIQLSVQSSVIILKTSLNIIYAHLSSIVIYLVSLEYVSLWYFLYGECVVFKNESLEGNCKYYCSGKITENGKDC